MLPKILEFSIHIPEFAVDPEWGILHLDGSIQLAVNDLRVGKIKMIYLPNSWWSTKGHRTSIVDIVRIYGKRWDIEVFFKMAKQYLKLAKEIQCRDFDTLIANTYIVFMRYMFLAYQCRIETDHRTFGDLS